MNKQQAEMKEYLSQAFRIDQRIQSKMEQVASLNDLATRATATYSDMPGSETRNLHRMEDAILPSLSWKQRSMGISANWCR